MPSRSVTVRLSVTDDFSQSLDSYNRKMGTAARHTDTIGTNAGRAENPLNRAGNAIGGVIAAISLKEVIDFASHLNDLGTKAQGVEDRFDALVGPIGDADEVMRDLREATLGVASDMDIQQGANLLMNMGLAEDADELEEIIGMITRLKNPTDDLGGAIENFSLMMANQSVQRLDSFGLSSGRVRQRINELLESGQALNREEAFKMATLEEGRRAILRLGDSAEIAGNSMGRLQTHIDNAMQDFGQNFSAGVGGIAGLIELGLGIHPAQIAKAEQDAQAAGEVVALAMQEGLLSEDTTAGLNEDFIAEYIRRSAVTAMQNPDMGLQDVRRRVMNELFDENEQYVRDMGLWSYYTSNATGPLADQLDMLTMISGEAMTLQANAAQRAAEEARVAEELERQAAAEEERRLHAEMVSEASALYRESRTQENDALEEMFRHVEGISGGWREMADMDPPRFMTREQADRIAEMAEETQATYDDMLRLSEIDETLYTDTQLENAREAAENVKQMADDADRAASAFENMSLTDLFGQTNGGMLGEIQALVLDQARASGEMSEEELAALEREFALSSGQETAGSLAMSEQFAPVIADIAAQEGPGVASAMTEELGRILSEAALAGIDVNSEEFLSQVAADLGAGMMMQDFDATEYVTAMTEAEDAALEAATSMDSVSEDTAAVSEDMPTAADAAADLTTNLADATTEAGALETVITRLSSAVHTVKVVLDVDSSALAGLIAQLTRDNGGVPPGSDGRLAPGQAA